MNRFRKPASCSSAVTSHVSLRRSRLTSGSSGETMRSGVVRGRGPAGEGEAMYGYVLMAMVMAHPYAAGVSGELAEEQPPPKPRKPPRGGKTTRVTGTR